jgi:hypothetical protein
MSTRKSPAASGAKITAADIEAAERDRIVAASLKLQQAMAAGPPPSSPNSDTAKVLAALDRAERPPTADEIASRLDADRRRYIEAKNSVGAAENRALAARLRASGYRGWTGGDR